MTILIETTGAFALTDLHQADIASREISHMIPTVVQATPFVNNRIALGQIKLLGKLKDDATQADFMAYVKEAEDDMPLAIESFLSEFGAEAVSKTVVEEEEEEEEEEKDPEPEVAE